jgi:hypothetical protein
MLPNFNGFLNDFVHRTSKVHTILRRSRRPKVISTQQAKWFNYLSNTGDHIMVMLQKYLGANKKRHRDKRHARKKVAGRSNRSKLNAAKRKPQRSKRKP